MSVAREVMRRVQRGSKLADWRLQLGVLLAALALAALRGAWAWVLIAPALTLASIGWAKARNYSLQDPWMPPALRIATILVLALVSGGVVVSAIGRMLPHPTPVSTTASQPRQANAQDTGDAKKPLPGDDDGKRTMELYLAAKAGLSTPESREALDPDTREALEALPDPGPVPPPAPGESEGEGTEPPVPDMGPVIAKDAQGVGGWLGRLCKEDVAGAAISPSCAILGLMLGHVGVSLGGGEDIHEQAQTLRLAQNKQYGRLIEMLARRPSGSDAGLARVLERLQQHVGVDKAGVIEEFRTMAPRSWCALLTGLPPESRTDWLAFARSHAVQVNTQCGS
jgi:hypothetical protein